MNSLSAAGEAQKGANDQIFTFQAKLAVLTLRHMKPRKEPNDQIFYISSQAGRFDIAPYEQFIYQRPAKPRKEPNEQIFTF